MNRPLRILLINDTLVWIATSMIIPIYAIFVGKIGGDILDAGMAASVFAVTAGVTVLIMGRISDRIKRLSRVVAIGYMINGTGFLLYIFVDNVWQLLGVQALIGLSQASVAPAFDALYTKNIGNPKKASSRWSVWEAGYYFAVAIGSALGAVIVKFASFDTLFVLMACLCYGSGLYVMSRPKRVL